MPVCLHAASRPVIIPFIAYMHTCWDEQPMCTRAGIRSGTNFICAYAMRRVRHGTAVVDASSLQQQVPGRPVPSLLLCSCVSCTCCVHLKQEPGTLVALPYAHATLPRPCSCHAPLAIYRFRQFASFTNAVSFASKLAARRSSGVNVPIPTRVRAPPPGPTPLGPAPGGVERSIASISAGPMLQPSYRNSMRRSSMLDVIMPSLQPADAMLGHPGSETLQACSSRVSSGSTFSAVLGSSRSSGSSSTQAMLAATPGSALSSKNPLSLEASRPLSGRPSSSSYGTAGPHNPESKQSTAQLSAACPRFSRLSQNPGGTEPPLPEDEESTQHLSVFPSLQLGAAQPRQQGSIAELLRPMSGVAPHGQGSDTSSSADCIAAASYGLLDGGAMRSITGGRGGGGCNSNGMQNAWPVGGICQINLTPRRATYNESLLDSQTQMRSSGSNDVSGSGTSKDGRMPASRGFQGGPHTHSVHGTHGGEAVTADRRLRSGFK